MDDIISLKKALFTKKDFLVTVILSVGYLLSSTFVLGFKSDQLVLILIFNCLYYASHLTRKFVTGFSIFIVYWILYDYMKALPNYLFNSVSVEELYNLEKRFFGIDYQGTILTPNEYCEIHANTFFDIMSGVFYLMWIPVPLGFAAWLFFKNPEQFLCFSLTFVLVNLLGFTIYYLYPAAAPWYVQIYGFGFNPETPGNTGGLIRFDKYFNVPVFQTIYTKGSNVFAAMPSLHASYPIVVLYYAVKNEFRIGRVLLALVMLGIWMAAVYTSHHYVLDVLAGILFAAIGIILFNWLKTTKYMEWFINGMLRQISQGTFSNGNHNGI